MKQTSLRKIDLMRRTFGSLPGHTCTECTHFRRGRYHDKGRRKCDIYGMTHSEASDWTGNWEACGMYNMPYAGRHIIEIVTHSASRPEPPIDGQVEIREATP